MGQEWNWWLLNRIGVQIGVQSARDPWFSDAGALGCLRGEADLLELRHGIAVQDFDAALLF